MDGAKTRTKRRFLKTRPDARTEAQKEDMSGETRTYGNPKSEQGIDGYGWKDYKEKKVLRREVKFLRYSR